MKEENLAVFADYLAQIGVEDVHEVLAEISTELGNDHLYSIATDPEVYQSLA